MLDETNIGSMLSETSSTKVKSILSDQTVRISASSTLPGSLSIFSWVTKPNVFVTHLLVFSLQRPIHSRLYQSLASQRWQIKEHVVAKKDRYNCACAECTCSFQSKVGIEWRWLSIVATFFSFVSDVLCS